MYGWGWYNYIIICFAHIVITCSGLAPPTNGVISFTNPIAPHVFGTVANYTCNVGYGLVGNVERSCGGLIGEWDGSNPTCVGENLCISGLQNI